MAHAALIDREQRRSLRELTRGALWVLGTAAVLRGLAVLLAEAPMAAALFAAFVADLAARRAGVSWDEPLAAAPARRRGDLALALPRWRSFVQLGTGAGTALAALTCCIAIGAAFGWITVRAGQPSAALLPASLRAVATAVRDELAVRGLVLAACTRAGVPSAVAIGVAGLAGAAPLALEGGATAAAVILATTSGILFAALWRTGAAWAAIGGHTAWALTITALFRGALVDIEWSRGRLDTGSLAQGAPAWLAAACAAVAAVVVLAHLRRRSGAP